MPPANPQPIHGPPEFVRAAAMQQAYWTHNAEELSQQEWSAADSALSRRGRDQPRLPGWGYTARSSRGVERPVVWL